MGAKMAHFARLSTALKLWRKMARNSSEKAAAVVAETVYEEYHWVNSKRRIGVEVGKSLFHL
jgi:hypothetical protein